MRAAALLLVLVPRIALGDDAPPSAPAAPTASVSRQLPVTIIAGLGRRRAWFGQEERADSNALLLVAAYRVRPQLAVGIRSAATRTTGVATQLGNFSGYETHWSVIAVDVAVTALYTEGHVSVAPWIGRRLTRVHEDTSSYGASPVTTMQSASTEWSDDATTYGLTLTVGRPRNLPIAAFVDAETTVGAAIVAPGVALRYSAVTIGVAFWL